MPKCALKPLGNKVVIDQREAESVTSGGIILPEAAKEKPKRGIIKSVGPGRVLDNGELSKPQVKVGNDVLYTSYAGTEVEVNGEKLIIMDETDVLAIIE